MISSSRSALEKVDRGAVNDTVWCPAGAWMSGGKAGGRGRSGLSRLLVVAVWTSLSAPISSAPSGSSLLCINRFPCGTAIPCSNSALQTLCLLKWRNLLILEVDQSKYAHCRKSGSIWIAGLPLLPVYTCLVRIGCSWCEESRACSYCWHISLLMAARFACSIVSSAESKTAACWSMLRKIQTGYSSITAHTWVTRSEYLSKSSPKWATTSNLLKLLLLHVQPE